MLNLVFFPTPAFTDQAHPLMRDVARTFLNIRSFRDLKVPVPPETDGISFTYEALRGQRFSVKPLEKSL